MGVGWGGLKICVLHKWDASWGSVYPKRHRQHCDNSAMTLVILFSLKTMEYLENGLQLQFSSDSIIFNENRIASVMELFVAALKLMFGANGAFYPGMYVWNLQFGLCAEPGGSTGRSVYLTPGGITYKGSGHGTRCCYGYNGLKLCKIPISKFSVRRFFPLEL